MERRREQRQKALSRRDSWRGLDTGRARLAVWSTGYETREERWRRSPTKGERHDGSVEYGQGK